MKKNIIITLVISAVAAAAAGCGTSGNNTDTSLKNENTDASAAGITEETTDIIITEESVQGMYDGGAAFLGTWVSGEDSITITEGDTAGRYTVKMYLPVDSSQEDYWVYQCYYNADTDSLESDEGYQETYRYSSPDKDPEIIHEDNEKASFYKNDEGIMWEDHIDHHYRGVCFLPEE